MTNGGPEATHWLGHKIRRNDITTFTGTDKDPQLRVLVEVKEEARNLDEVE